MVNKKEFVENTLAETLRSAQIDVARLELSEDGSTVKITFDSGYSKLANIEADSFGAIILDVTRKAMY